MAAQENGSEQQLSQVRMSSFTHPLQHFSQKDYVLAKPVEAGKCRQVCAYYLSDHSLHKLRKFNHSQERFWRNTAEIHLRSLIGACLCMCLYMNSAVLMRENVAEKMYVRERQAQIIRLITTWFISEHR